MYYVYILATKYNKMLYVGVTGNLEGRVRQHKRKEVPGFTKQYNITKLVYYEEFHYVHDAIYREKQIKGWLRKKKDSLITNFNPEWKDLSEGWYTGSLLSS
ncbi:MAG: GIY-YIG nuclease family protein [Parcubacteria group bacterium]